MFCKNCGNELNTQTRFCTECGAEVPMSNNNQGNYGNTCPKCGNLMRVGASFCSQCGYSSETRVEPVAVAKPANKNNTLVAIIAILLVVILVCVGVLGYILYTMNADDDKDVPSMQVEERDEVEEYIDNDTEDNESERYSEDAQEYLFPSDREYITEYDLRYMTKEEVALIRNEIYARHGYIFKSETYQSYFESKDWYRPNPYFNESSFNEIEKINKDFIVEYEKSMGWR